MTDVTSAAGVAHPEYRSVASSALLSNVGSLRLPDRIPRFPCTACFGNTDGMFEICLHLGARKLGSPYSTLSGAENLWNIDDVRLKARLRAFKIIAQVGNTRQRRKSKVADSFDRFGR